MENVSNKIITIRNKAQNTYSIELNKNENQIFEYLNTVNCKIDIKFKMNFSLRRGKDYHRFFCVSSFEWL